jgi:hypothetical protein
VVLEMLKDHCTSFLDSLKVACAEQ